MSKDLEAQAESIRAELRVPQQNDVFRQAVEAGYLAALADGKVDEGEISTIVRAIDLLSKGAVIEWEASTLMEECAARASKEGVEARALAVGGALKNLGQAEAGILFAAFIARATNGVDKKEAEMLKKIGKAAGLAAKQVGELVKKAGLLEE
jgi:tellurite resistance protein